METRSENNVNEIGLSCFGCRSCEQVCPNKCISMKRNHEGFLYPVISESCVQCGICLKRCPANNIEQTEKEPLETWGFKLDDKETIMKSASGGAGIAAIKTILEYGGVVYGAAYDDKLKVRHVEVYDARDADQLQSSKYVQSDTGDCYLKAKGALQAGKKVLFTGTPCQVAGLYAYLGKRYENLYTVDLICHGVPSPLFFEKYIEYQDKKMNGKTIYYNFRSKDKRGWGTQYLLKTKTKTKTKTSILSLDKYGKHFLDGDCYRECCYQCPFANTNRPSDITIGDFWGIMKSHPEFYSGEGVSSVLVNTEKGLELFAKMKDRNSVIEVTLEEVLVKQGNLVGPSERTSARDFFYKRVEEDDFVENIRVGVQAGERLKAILPANLTMWLKRLRG